MANSKYLGNPEDPNILSGNYNFSDDIFDNIEIFIPTVINGVASPIEQVNADFKDLHHLLLIGHLNARSVPKHFYEIERILHETNFDIVGVSETFLKTHSPKNLCNISGYKFFRKDHLYANGGGGWGFL